MVVQIEQRRIGDDEPTYVIAEAGINHNGDLSVAKELVTAADRAGADAVKFQTYKTDERAEEDSEIYDILDRCELSRADQRELFEFARERGMTMFSTPFDVDSVEFLDDLGVPAFKVASFHITHKKLLRAIAETGKPVIFSSGMATLDEVRSAIEIFDDHDVAHVLLHCVSSYPTDPTDTNLEILRTLDTTFDCPVGFSDHTIGTEVPSLSVAVGADAIEKHFTLDTSMEGPDHGLSLDPEGLESLVDEVRRVESILGDGTVRRLDAEADTVKFREETE
jgi:N-acetylneuraminate synthase/N,N'-diacetyllegionaminate synthase